MPVIIKNGKVYGDRSVTLSRAEYNALSEVEKNNGTTYYIYDVNSFVQANEVGLDGGTVEDLAGSVATIETSPATAAHSVGEFILWNGTLYSVTAAISVGETLTVGSNITATSAGEELQALKNGLTARSELLSIGNYQAGSQAPVLTKVGSLRIVSLFALKNLTSNGTVTLTNLPSDSIPNASVTILASDTSNLKVSISANNDGTLTCYAYSTTNVNIRAQLIYTV